MPTLNIYLINKTKPLKTPLLGSKLMKYVVKEDIKKMSSILFTKMTSQIQRHSCNKYLEVYKINRYMPQIKKISHFYLRRNIT
jgi:hypothetical protein